MEVKDIKKEKESIISFRKIAFKYINVYEEKSNHHSNLIDNIKQTLINKMNFTDSFKQTDSIFEKSALEENIKLKTHKAPLSSSLKKSLNIDRTKSLNERVEEMDEFYQKLQETLSDSSPEFVKTVQFQRFKEMNEKNVELRVIFFFFGGSEGKC